MPTYEYESDDPPLKVIAIRGVADRDRPIIFRRVQVPSSVSLVNTDSGRAKADTMEKGILSGYRKLEDKLGADFSKSGKFTKKQIAEAWKPTS